MRIGITCYPIDGGSGAEATEQFSTEKVVPLYEAQYRDVLEGKG
jgi:hypothetical protein